MSTPRPGTDRDVVVQAVLADKRRRLGTALQQLAADLARERRRNRELQRELADLRDQAASSQGEA